MSKAAVRKVRSFTVEQVIAELSKQPKDAVVVMSSDEEGNMYSPLQDFTEAAPFEITQYTNSNGIEAGTKVVILYPSH